MNDRPPDGAQLAAWPDETMANLPVMAASRTAPMNACLMNTPSEAADYHMPCEQPHRANPRLCPNDDADGNPVASLGKVFHWSVAGFQRDSMGLGVGRRGSRRIAAKTVEFPTRKSGQRRALSALGLGPLCAVTCTDRSSPVPSLAAYLAVLRLRHPRL